MQIDPHFWDRNPHVIPHLQAFGLEHAFAFTSRGLQILRTRHGLPYSLWSVRDFLTIGPGAKTIDVIGDGFTCKAEIRALWQAWPGKRIFPAGVLFTPDLAPGDQGLFWNSWSGWAVAPDGRADWSLIERFIRDRIASGSEAQTAYVLDWLAQMVQRPAERPGTALVLETGDSDVPLLLARIIRRLAGSHSYNVDPILYGGPIPSRDLLIGHATLALDTGTKPRLAKLRRLLAGEAVRPQRDYRPQINYQRFMLSAAPGATPDWPELVPITAGRFGRTLDEFNAIEAQLETGAGGFLAHLMGRDLSRFDPRASIAA
ncbi:hypothetical protein E8L99_16580 [Phreatobacter aquaticus]|uniref:Uncharacterized protein n=1 Tax=Phreatobacter aquaticus TaxID=2570229 RepID=A0A4D7QIJ4_9HYPH|nr:hypothetical protein [Phreatobacter aquaticus]QCK87258.1 hypothetical protein E8L99_16580 [Phreatobacter aquaticus]